MTTLSNGGFCRWSANLESAIRVYIYIYMYLLLFCHCEKLTKPNVS